MPPRSVDARRSTAKSITNRARPHLNAAGLLRFAPNSKTKSAGRLRRNEAEKKLVFVQSRETLARLSTLLTEAGISRSRSALAGWRG
ncbi:MAG TPA: hypothetical protein VFY53_08230, partial [Rhodoplanes sp.]|nr:hypothetical protein [Rhodoplanes sp.]